MSSEGITILAVAQLAKVSPSTVSNVLNGRHDRMRPATRERVWHAIEQLGYAPNLVARELKTGVVPIIGLIVPSVANPFWGAFARCVELAALARGYQVLLCNSERLLEREQRYAESLMARGIRAVIFGSSSLSVDYMHSLTKRGLQPLAFDRQVQSNKRVRVDSVRVDNVQGAQLAVNHLLGLGHRRIGFVAGPIDSANRLDRLNGYRAALTAAGIEPDTALIWDRATGERSGDTEGTELGGLGASELLSLPEPPTAIFAINDMTAFGVYAAVRERAMHVPTHISVVGFDDIGLARVVEPPLTTIKQPLEEMMRAAVHLLISRLEGVSVGPPTHLTLEPVLVVRASTAPAPASG